jgi:chitinase
MSNNQNKFFKISADSIILQYLEEIKSNLEDTSKDGLSATDIQHDFFQNEESINIVLKDMRSDEFLLKIEFNLNQNINVLIIFKYLIFNDCEYRKKIQERIIELIS